ncbi:MAG: histidine kinase dimerization/phospho-acceptor domain-containing protein [Gemmatimonadota bacterium]
MSQPGKHDPDLNSGPEGLAQEVVRAAAHDFNNALTTIRGRVQLLLEEGPENPSWRSDVEEIGKAARRAELVVHRLVEWARVQDGEVAGQDPTD